MKVEFQEAVNVGVCVGKDKDPVKSASHAKSIQNPYNHNSLEYDVEP